MRQLNLNRIIAFCIAIHCNCFLQLKFCSAQSNEENLPSLEVLLESLESFEQIEIIDSVLSIGGKHLPKKDFDKVVEYAEWSLTHSQNIDYVNGKAESYLLLSSIASRLNQYTLMVKWALNAERLLHEEKDINIKTQKNIYKSLSTGYTYLKRFKEAKTAYRKAIELMQISKDYKEEAGRYMGLGNVYYDHDIYDSALICFKKARRLYNQIKEGYARDYVEASFGNVYDAKGDFQNAKKSYKTALSIYRKNQYLFGITWMQNNLASTLTSQNEIPQAQLYLDSATRLATENKYHTWEPYLIENQIKIYEKRGNFKNAFKEQKKLQTLKDSLEESKAVKELSEINAFDLESKFETIRLKAKAVEEEAKQQKLISFLAIVSCTSAMLIIVIIGFFFRRKQIHHKELKAQHIEIAKTNKELQTAQKNLNDAHNKLHKLNVNLEDEVRKRTEELERKNLIITEYAHFNAHQLRGVVARFMGLFQLFEIASSIEEKEHYIELMSSAAEELDEQIHEISNILGEDFFHDLETKTTIND